MMGRFLTTDYCAVIVVEPRRAKPASGGAEPAPDTQRRTLRGKEGTVATYRVTSPGLNLRSAPNPEVDNRLGAPLNQGDPLEAAGGAPVTLSGGAIWINVRATDGRVGWVNSKHTDWAAQTSG